MFRRVVPSRERLDLPGRVFVTASARGTGTGGKTPDAPVDELRASERFCRELARREARNFYWGFLALPKEQRAAVYALYGFARQVDDEVDSPALAARRTGGPGAAAEHADRFARHRERIAQCVDGRADDPVMRVLREVVPRYGIPKQELEALIRGVEMDLRVNRYETWNELADYCRLVASSVGRMCVRIFGFTDSVALEYADDLGLAMQLANILRDVREDLDLGRIYLPQEDLRQFGLDETGLIGAHPGAAWEALVRHEITRAESLFASGLRVTGPIPRRAAACVLTMAGMYRAILDEIERNPYLPLERRASLGKRAKVSVMARSWLQAV